MPLAPPPPGSVGRRPACCEISLQGPLAGLWGQDEGPNISFSWIPDGSWNGRERTGPRTVQLHSSFTVGGKPKLPTADAHWLFLRRPPEEAVSRRVLGLCSPRVRLAVLSVSVLVAPAGTRTLS